MYLVFIIFQKNGKLKLLNNKLKFLKKIDSLPKEKLKKVVVKESIKSEIKVIPKKKVEEKIILKKDIKIDSITPIIKDVQYKLHINNFYVPNKKVKEKNKSVKKELVKKEVKKVILEKTKIEVQKEPLLTMKKSSDSLVKMVKRYRKDKNYLLALKIAQSYYDSNQYSKSLLWAKKANILNKKDDKAWLLYAKSEYARGKTNRAIKILQLYLANAKSKVAESLLITWTQGE